MLMLSLQIINTSIAPHDAGKRTGTADTLWQNKTELVARTEIFSLHERIIGLIFENSESHKSERRSAGQPLRVLRHFEENILKYAV